MYPVTRQVGNSTPDLHTARLLTSNRFLLLPDESSEDTSGRLRHSNANLLFADPSKWCSCMEELDGADRFAFEEFGVGSKAKGFQQLGLHLF